MLLESLIRLADESLIESWFTHSGLVAHNQKNAASPRIECEGHSPYAARSAKAKLLHVGVARTVQRIDFRPSQGRSTFTQRDEHREQGILHCRRKLIELSLESRVELDTPLHIQIMRYSA